ncbi:histone-fold-containing protein [Trametopsis cervina]|nr:histone-fold-containing protein [Trametopsis cervina]
MPRKDAVALSTSNAQAQQDAVSEGLDAYELPKSLVTRMARSTLPDNTKLQKEMLHAVSNGSTVFVNYLAATAHDIAAGKQHKSVSASDVLKALEMIEMGDMVAKLNEQLQAYRDMVKTSKKGGSAKDKTAQDGSASSKGKAKSDSTGKGKEKATITIPSRSGIPAKLPAANPAGENDELEGDDEEMADAEEGGDDDVEEDGPEDVEDEDDGDEEEGFEDEEPQADGKQPEKPDLMDED